MNWHVISGLPLSGIDPGRFSEAEFSLRISRYNDSDYRRQGNITFQKKWRLLQVDWRDPLVPSTDGAI